MKIRYLSILPTFLLVFKQVCNSTQNQKRICRLPSNNKILRASSVSVQMYLRSAYYGVMAVLIFEVRVVLPGTGKYTHFFTLGKEPLHVELWVKFKAGDENKNTGHSWDGFTMWSFYA